uniref:KIND domain-containing protein n=1 Tax=Poecilia mexicana TaxID=48701 RepID=A0A3B3Y5T3_9TELE
MGTFVTLTEVLEARGSPLEEDEVWCLLLATADALLDISKKGDHVQTYTYENCTFLNIQFVRICRLIEKVYSLGMTLYWCADYHLPQNQPVQISTELEGLLLSMCEDMAVRRTDLLTVLETCEFHHKSSMLPSPERLIRQLVEDVYRNSASGRIFFLFVFSVKLTDRSQMVRDRLHMCLLSKNIYRNCCVFISKFIFIVSICAILRLMETQLQIDTSNCTETKDIVDYC